MNLEFSGFVICDLQSQMSNPKIPNPLCRKNINRNKTKTDPDNQTECSADTLNNGHIFRVIGTEGLECAPKTMTDMDGDNDHCNDVNKNISGC